MMISTFVLVCVLRSAVKTWPPCHLLVISGRSGMYSVESMRAEKHEEKISL